MSAQPEELSKRSPTAVTDALWQSYVRERRSDTRSLLLDQYLGLVHHAALEIRPQLPSSMEFEDLLSAGAVGLVQALESYDPTRGFAFSSFALPRIRGAMRDELRSWDWIPRTVRERNRHLRSVEDTLHRRLGRAAEPREVAAALGVDLETYWRYVDETKRPVMLALDPISAAGEPELRLVEALVDPLGRNPIDTMEENETLAQLAEAFASLPERDRLVLTLSYFEGLTLKEIGETLHITESRVSQIRTRAVERLSERIEPKRKAA